MVFLLQLLVGLALNVIGYLIAPKAGSNQKPMALSDLEEATADADRPIPWVFGSMTITGLNNIGDWDKAIGTRKMKTSKK